MARYRIGVDIGGTFTDFSVYETESGRVFGLKSPTIPHDPVEGLAVGCSCWRKNTMCGWPRSSTSCTAPRLP
jgi:N-methylhydantoinase A